MPEDKYRLQVIINYKRKDKVLFDDIVNLEDAKSIMKKFIIEQGEMKPDFADIFIKETVKDLNIFKRLNGKRKDVYVAKITPVNNDKHLSISLGVE